MNTSSGYRRGTNSVQIHDSMHGMATLSMCNVGSNVQSIKSMCNLGITQRKFIPIFLLGHGNVELEYIILICRAAVEDILAHCLPPSYLLPSQKIWLICHLLVRNYTTKNGSRLLAFELQSVMCNIDYNMRLCNLTTVPTISMFNGRSTTTPSTQMNIVEK